MSFDPYEFDRSYARQGPGVTMGQYAYRTFLWMFLGLMVTFGISVFLYLTNLTAAIYQYNSAPVVLLVAEVLVVVVLVARIHKLTVGTARGLFLFYSLLNGVVISTWLYIYALESVVLVFDRKALQEYLQVPEGQELMALIAVGWPREGVELAAPKRKAVSDLLTWK